MAKKNIIVDDDSSKGVSLVPDPMQILITTGDKRHHFEEKRAQILVSIEKGDTREKNFVYRTEVVEAYENNTQQLNLNLKSLTWPPQAPPILDFRPAKVSIINAVVHTRHAIDSVIFSDESNETISNIDYDSQITKKDKVIYKLHRNEYGKQICHSVVQFVSLTSVYNIVLPLSARCFKIEELQLLFTLLHERNELLWNTRFADFDRCSLNDIILDDLHNMLVCRLVQQLFSYTVSADLVTPCSTAERSPGQKKQKRDFAFVKFTYHPAVAHACKVGSAPEFSLAVKMHSVINWTEKDQEAIPKELTKIILLGVDDDNELVYFAVLISKYQVDKFGPGDFSSSSRGVKKSTNDSKSDSYSSRAQFALN
ncbi:hypothetical protein POM88_009890 [Heracleum sosnowskyi]|uniref:Uncharacterized protein n=1 Tax=Heracleum sosnowskyi TaxID=360622 RepID=A0AAD8J955_9APIA|nr:hypothetical protein POM88_009890 [Heracleum sosnowskyi]